MAITTGSKFLMRFADWHRRIESDNTIEAYTNNQWHRVTFTYNGAMGRIYFDGMLYATSTNTDYMWNTPAATYFGSNCRMLDSKTNFNGKLDNFRSYSRALSATEVQALYNARQ